MANLMVFGRNSSIVVTIGSFDGPIDETSDLCRDYVSRLSVAADYQPGDITKAAPISRERQIGRVIGYLLTPFLLLGIPGFLIYLISKFLGRKSAKGAETNS
jgi:hypothetical protein